MSGLVLCPARGQVRTVGLVGVKNAGVALHLSQKSWKHSQRSRKHSPKEQELWEAGCPPEQDPGGFLCPAAPEPSRNPKSFPFFVHVLAPALPGVWAGSGPSMWLLHQAGDITVANPPRYCKCGLIGWFVGILLVFGWFCVCFFFFFS